MDHNSIINRETFEVCTHAEDHPKVFVCDKRIAEAISILNKKGYKTVASCSGHYRVEFYEYFNKDLKYLDEFKKDKEIIIKNIREDGFDYWEEVTATCIYVLFYKKYNFEIPLGYELDEYTEDFPNTCIRHVIDFYENDKKRNRSDVEKEIDKYCNILKSWASNLPDMKERNDKNE